MDTQLKSTKEYKQKLTTEVLLLVVSFLSYFFTSTNKVVNGAVEIFCNFNKTYNFWQFAFFPKSDA